MRWIDGFLLGLSVFVAVNCWSYYRDSETPYVAGWGAQPWESHYKEEIGFPYWMCFLSGSRGCLVPVSRHVFLIGNWHIGHCIGNALIAIMVSYFFATRIAKGLPPPWSARPMAWRYSLGGLLIGITLVCSLLGMASLPDNVCAVIRNCVCFAAPICVYLWYLWRGRLGWGRLIASGLGLTLFAMAADIGYQLPDSDTSRAMISMLPGDWMDHSMAESDLQAYWHDRGALLIAGISILRAMVPIFGLLATAVVVTEIYRVLQFARYEPEEIPR
jgi:hypothetical protein